MKSIPRLALSSALLASIGCSLADPWGEVAAAPRSPSAPFAPAERGAAPRPEERPSLRGRTLTLAECIAIALERHPATQGSWQAARAAAARVGEERAAFFPTVDLSGSAVRSDTRELRIDGTSPQTETSGIFGARYTLFDGGVRQGRLEGARADLVSTNERHNQTLQDVALAVQLSYAERLAGRALVQVAEEAAKQSGTHVELAQARRRAGVAARFDVLKAETEKADADLALVRARGAARVAQGRLCQAMGLRVSEAFEIEDFPEDAPQKELAQIERLLEEAAKSRPELRAALAQVEARQADVQVADAGHLPVVTAGADYGWRDKGYPSFRHEWSLGIGVTLPLFEGFRATYRSGRARSDLARAVAEYEGLLNGVELEVWTSYSRALEAADAVEAARKFVESAEESARAAEGMYRSGVGSIIELVDSLAARTAARTRLVQARLDWATAKARLDRSLGRTRAEDK